MGNEMEGVDVDKAQADGTGKSPAGSSKVNLAENKESEPVKNYPWNCPVYDKDSRLWTHPYAVQMEEAARLSYDAWKTPCGANGWAVSTNKEDLQIYRKQRKDKAVDILKGRCILPFPVGMVVKEMMSRESKLKYETNLEVCKMLESYGPGSLLEYSLARTPTRLIAQRDMCMVFGTVLLEKEGTVMVAYKSVESSLCPPKDEFVRVDLCFAGWIFEPLGEGSTQITTIIDIDVKAGYVPGWVLNLCNESIGKAGYQLKLYMEKKYSKSNKEDENAELSI